MNNFTHGQIVTFADTKFRVEIVNEKYTMLHPIDDPDWILRHCEIVAPREKAK